MVKKINAYVLLLAISNSVPVAFSYSQTIATGGAHSMVICDDKTLMIWGSNVFGQFGNGTNINSVVPLQNNSLTGIIAIAAGDAHSLALNNIGTVWTWGINANGQLGDGSNVFDSNVPVQVSSLTGVIAIRGGGFHSLALKKDSTVWAWGENNNGQLGDGTNTPSNVPVQVSSLKGIIGIAAAGLHSLAVKSDGTVWAWGWNTNGQLGNGTSTFFENVPVQVDSLTDIIAVAGGANFSLALKNDSTVWAWGLNSSGELGTGNNTSSNVPVQVNSLTGIMAIEAGGWHSIALKNNGTVWAWGANNVGELGDSTNITRNVPVQVSNLAGVTAISSEGYHSLCIKKNGTLWAWGSNSNGELGNGDSIDSNVPVQVKGLCTLNSINKEKIALSNFVSPNPGRGQYYFENFERNNLIEVYDISGRLIFKIVNLNGDCVVDLTERENGVYFYKVIGDSFVYSGKLIKQ
ncbi:MAG: T9SS type A sorting domain-containing protein [Bacteroidia bacterium]|nr:T9SS type A sorting domain-containing protein [Bacteroidia bacterium]